MYNREDKIFVRINKVGFIPYIGMCGPIPNPIKIPVATCLQMVTAGIDVFEVNPDTKETVKLTVQNVFDDNKFDKKPVQSVPVKERLAPPVGSVTFTGVKTPEPKQIDDNTSSVKEDSSESNEELDNMNNATEKETKQQNVDLKNKNKNKNRK